MSSRASHLVTGVSDGRRFFLLIPTQYRTSVSQLCHPPRRRPRIAQWVAQPPAPGI